jgi:hypothetical protein
MCAGWLAPSGKKEHSGQACPSTKAKEPGTEAERGGRYEKVVKNTLGVEQERKMGL